MRENTEPFGTPCRNLDNYLAVWHPSGVFGAETSVITEPFGTQGRVRSTAPCDTPLPNLPPRALGVLYTTSRYAYSKL